MARGKIRYGLFIELPRAALLEAYQSGYRGKYVAAGDLTEENLNWLSELSAKDGWHQRSATQPGDRAVIMDISNDSDKEQ